jgi:electron transport complex protein RnfC
MGWFDWQCDDAPWPRQLPTFRTLEFSPQPAGSQTYSPDRHGSPNLQAQLECAQREPADTVICSALDGDPSLRLNAAVANRRAAQVVNGVRKLAEICGATQTWIAVEADAPPAWDGLLRQAARDGNVQIVEMANHYPQADPTLLLYTLTRRKLKPGLLPTECGVILVDAPAAAEFAAAAPGPMPIGIYDHEHCGCSYFDVPAGISWKEVFRAAGISTDGMTIIAGDWPRNRCLDCSSLVGSGELTVQLAARSAPVNPQSCIRCGWCVQVCPTLAHPALLLEAAQLGDPNRARRGRLSACIECGVCDQICPSSLPLLAAIRKIK